jgi:plasmid stabilization system protein ParE
VNIRFLTFARQEIDEAYLWFEEKSSGKGVDFLDELDRAVRLVITYPLAFPEVEPGIRRCLLARFPYGILYGIDGDTIVVLAVSHAHRRPKYWIGRVSG